jgi:uncharacterized protein
VGFKVISVETARLWYPQDDAVHGFDHILRVYHMARHLAAAEGADQEIVAAAALLHDARPLESLDPASDLRQDHHLVSSGFAESILQQEGWPVERIEAVLHCIRAHRFRDDREQPATLEAQALFDADKLDAIGAIGVARAVAYAAQHGQPAFAEPSPGFLTGGLLQPGEPHSAYHEYVFKLSRLKDRFFTHTARQIAAARHEYMAGFFERLRLEQAIQV